LREDSLKNTFISKFFSVNNSMKKIALITGVSGQDGSYLANFLKKKNYIVYGVGKSASHLSKELKTMLAGFYEIDLNDPLFIKTIILELRPNEIYHLAAFHFSSQENGNNKMSFNSFNNINLVTTNIILETINEFLIECRFFYASSAHVFGKVEKYPQTEKFPFKPETLYGITKAAGSELCRFYQNFYNIYASVGILYNHESPRRQSSFITSQIAQCAANAIKGLNPKLIVSNLDAVVDWGYAEDYVEAMWLTLQQNKSDIYIISTGIGRTVRDFSKIAFEFLDLDYQKYIFQDDKKIIKQATLYIGDNSKIMNECGWTPKCSFKDIVQNMVLEFVNKKIV
jgi:GDPmannose 4,6-dehydratase